MATSQGVWDLSSPTGDLTWASCIRSKGSSPLDLTGAPSFRFDGAYHGSSVVLKVLYVLISSSQACDGCAPITSTLQTKPQRFREIEQLVQDHTDRNWDSWSTPAYRVVLEEWDRRLLHVQQFFLKLHYIKHLPHTRCSHKTFIRQVQSFWLFSWCNILGYGSKQPCYNKFFSMTPKQNINKTSKILIKTSGEKINTFL